MRLSNYQKKRDFKKTPEPADDEKKYPSQFPIFVIQKHDATSLHYDLRLEAGGVLKSWAIPKGPMIDPTIHHLALMVEDHPRGYADFEGIIPAGNYGAGTVIIWDRGEYWTPGAHDKEIIEKDILEGIEKGHITFILKGDKLQGEYALIRLKKSKERNAWLLIKAKDEFAKNTDITKEQKSLVSGKKNQELNDQPYEILKDLPDSPRPIKIKPMLATLADRPFNKSGWLFEIKWDGYRIIADIDGEKTRLISRNNKVLNNKFEAIFLELRNTKLNCILDGEMVVFDNQGYPSFNLIQIYPEGGGNLVYYVFDLIFFNHKILNSLPLIKRKELLSAILPKLSSVKLSDHIETFGVDLFEFTKEKGIEGIMAKRTDSIYMPSIRSREWLKIKNYQQMEAIIGGFTKPKNGRTPLGSLLLGVNENNNLRYIGNVGTGFSEKEMKRLFQHFAAITQNESPFSAPLKFSEPVFFLRPELVCEVKFQEWTKDGILRQAVYLGLREDIEPKSVKKETPFPIKEVLSD